MMKNNQKDGLPIKVSAGFSLIELMVVIVIIGILTTFAIPSYNRYVEKTKFTNAYSLASSYKRVVLEYAMLRNGFRAIADDPIGLNDSDLLLKGNIINATVESLEDGRKATMTFTLVDDLNIKINENTQTQIIFSAEYKNGSVVWTCTLNNIQSYFVPTECN